MDILTEIQNRRSIRKYKSKEVTDQGINRILEAALLAPSGSNTQPWKFIVIRNERLKEKIVEVDHKQKWMLTAPVFIVCLADIGVRIKNNDMINLEEDSTNPELKLIIRDTSIAISYLMLEAQHQGLNTCWTGWYEQKEMRTVLGIPSSMYVSGIITLGYADENPKQRPRKSIDDIVEFR
ncbi:MAG: nitroreductase family protein [Thomasclavelia sp.]|nr:nitroreductase family protein [Thomasclavelia sp.]